MMCTACAVNSQVFVCCGVKGMSTMYTCALALSAISYVDGTSYLFRGSFVSKSCEANAKTSFHSMSLIPKVALCLLHTAMRLPRGC